jgi:hypothetical protein
MTVLVVGARGDVGASTGGKPVPVSHVVPEVTGRPGLTYGQWASDHAADFR